MKAKFSRILVIAVLIVCCRIIPVFAADSMIKQAVNDDDYVKLYVSGIDEDQKESKFQVGNSICDVVKVYPIEDDDPMRTLILVDNSLSITKENREKIGDLLESIVDVHGENEQFRLATFEKGVEYLSDFSNDYTALKRLAKTIDYSDQDTYLSNVLSGIIDELKEEKYQGYTRLIVIADGVDNKQTGMATEELYNKLKETGFPVYTVGSKGKNNEAELEDMYAISDITHAYHCVLDDVNNIGDIASALKDDQSMTVFRIKLSDEAKNGAVQSGQLTLEDGTKLVIDLRTPFADVSEEAPKEGQEKNLEDNDIEETVSAVGSEEAELEDEDEIGDDTDDEDKNDISSFIRDHLVMIIIIGASVLVLLIIIVLIMMKASSKSKKKGLAPSVPHSSNEETEFINIQNSDDGTQMLFADADRRNTSAHTITLTDRMDPARQFMKPLHHPIIIGRSSGADIMIKYDKSISGKHCLIKEESGRFFIQDMGSANKTKLNGEVILSETELSSGDVITLGRVEMMVRIQ